MTPEQEAAVARFSAASRRIHQVPDYRHGGRGAETEYAAAYQNMAKLGLVQPLKRKHRTAAHGGGRKA